MSGCKKMDVDLEKGLKILVLSLAGQDYEVSKQICDEKDLFTTLDENHDEIHAVVTPNKLLDGLDKAKAAAEAKASAEAKLAAERKAADQLGLIDSSKIITEPHKTAIVALAIPELKGKATLLFRASDHGWSGNDFHAKCDDKGRTLTLIKTTKGRSCGGFTSVPWGKGGVYKDDPTAFLFSLDL